MERAWILGAAASGAHPRPPPLAAVTLAELEELSDKRISTGDRAVDRLLGGGFGEGESVLVHGPRGSGKSRATLRWAGHAGGLVVSLEMSPGVLRHTAESAGADLGRVWVVGEGDDWRGVAERCRARIVVVDSISRLTADAVEWCREAMGWAARHRAAVLFISHENKRGTPLGAAALGHDPDAVFRVENARGDGTARLAVKKRRLSPLGSCRVELVPGALHRLKHRGQRLVKPEREAEAGDVVRGTNGHEPRERHRSAAK